MQESAPVSTSRHSHWSSVQLVELADQQLGVDGLREQVKGVTLLFGGLEQVGSCGLAGEEQDACVGAHLLDSFGSLDAVHPGHDDVRNNGIRAILQHLANGLPAVIGDTGFEAVKGEDAGDAVGDGALIVYYQDGG